MQDLEEDSTPPRKPRNAVRHTEPTVVDDAAPTPPTHLDSEDVQKVQKWVNKLLTNTKMCELQFLPCLALPYLALPCLALPCRAVTCLAVSCRDLPCRVLPCRDLAYTLPCPSYPDFTSATHRFVR